MAKGCALSTGYLPWGGLPRNSVDRITDRPDMTSAVDRGRRASTQTNKQTHQDNMSVKCISPYIPILFSKTGVHKGIHFFLIFALKHRLWVLVEAFFMCTHNQCFRVKKRKILKFFI